MSTPASGPITKRLRAGSRDELHRDQHDREQHDVVEPALEREHLARLAGNFRRTPQEPTHHHGIGGRECRAEDRGKRRSQAKQCPRGDGDDDCRQERAWTQDQPNQVPIAPHFGEVDTDGIGEEHQHETERRDRSEDLGVELETHQPEAEWAEDEAEKQEERDLREPRPLDETGEQRGDENNDADQSKGRGVHEAKNIVGAQQGAPLLK